MLFGTKALYLIALAMYALAYVRTGRRAPEPGPARGAAASP